ncbi:MAG: bifunctional DNA primase/polymerase [Betaproteobacteria bacterium]|nr:bifunctional DNA primase/polymerase [Betaproteobacteria bacterium]
MDINYMCSAQQPSSALEAVEAFMERKWMVIPVEYQSKKCHVNDWPNYQAAEHDLTKAFASPCNVGILLGKSNLTDVDIDSLSAVPFMDWLPKTNACWGRAGNPNSHHLYAGVRKSRSFKNGAGMVIEIRSEGRYSVAPPSLHVTGEPYTWESYGEPAICENLEQAVIKIAVAATLLPAWKAGVRHELALAVSGLLLKAGWALETVTDLVTRVANAAYDSEVADRITAVNTTAKAHNNGDQVVGYSRLVEILGDADASAIGSWVGGSTNNLCDRAGTAKSVKAKRHVAQEFRKDMQSRGVFYKTRQDDLLFFHRQERELYVLGSPQFRALCGELHGINGKEPVWAYIEEELQQYCLRRGEPTEFFQFARYQDHRLYIHAGGQRVYRLDGQAIDEVNNGDDGVLFKSDPSLAPIHPDFAFSGSPVREHLVNANAANPGHLDLFHLYIYSLFFESRLPTKPIVLIVGPKGSGKTSTGRALKRALHGPSTNVDSGMAGREDAFWAGICNNSLVCIDNVDTLVPWLADAMAVVATGATFKRRRLYETNSLVEYQPRCFVMVTSRNPQSFLRDDVVDRMLLIEVERRQNFIEESHFLAQIEAKRNPIWGELLTNLNNMVAILKAPLDVTPLSSRLADWARLATSFAPVLGIADIEKKLKAMDASKVEFSLEDDPLVHGLDEWLEKNPDADFVASGDLYKQISDIFEQGNIKFPVKDARAFGMLLRNLRQELGTRYQIEEKTGSSNKRLYRMRKIGAAQQLPNEDTGSST